MRLFKIDKSPRFPEPENTGFGYLDEELGSPHLRVRENAVRTYHDRTKENPAVVGPVAEETSRIRDQADGAHQAVLETLRMMDATEASGYHPFEKESSADVKERSRREEKEAFNAVKKKKGWRDDPWVLSCERRAVQSWNNLDDKRPSTPTLAQESFPRKEKKESSAKASKRVDALLASPSPAWNIETPPLLPMLLPAFSSKSKELSSSSSSYAQVNLYFILELPNQGDFIHSPCSPLQLSLPLPLPSRHNHHRMPRASAIATLQHLFFHGVPHAFFQRFFPFQHLLASLSGSSRGGGGDRGTLVWTIPQLFSSGYKHRALVEKVWEAGKMGLRGSWVDAGEVGFAMEVVALLGRIVEAEMEENNGEADDGCLDIAVVVRQYHFPQGQSGGERGSGGYGRPMDVRRIRREAVPRGAASWAGPRFSKPFPPCTPPDYRAWGYLMNLTPLDLWQYQRSLD